MDFSIRTETPELLDLPDIPAEDIYQNMKELSFINRWLGGHRITKQGFLQLAESGMPLSICEIGCGGGDNLKALEKSVSSQIRNMAGIDINTYCVDYAKRKNWSFPVKWITSDYKLVSFDELPDILFCSLFCHHFKEKELVAQLRWMHQNCNRGFFINDLHRHPLAFHSIRLLTYIFSRSYLVKNDAPLSVLRGFKKKELESLLKKAGIYNFRIQWKWAFRWLILVQK